MYVVPAEGFEPPTNCLQGSCSTRLSYAGSNQLTDRLSEVRAPCRNSPSAEGKGMYPFFLGLETLAAWARGLPDSVAPIAAAYA